MDKVIAVICAIVCIFALAGYDLHYLIGEYIRSRPKVEVEVKPIDRIYDPSQPTKEFILHLDDGGRLEWEWNYWSGNVSLLAEDLAEYGCHLVLTPSEVKVLHTVLGKILENGEMK